MAGRRSRLWPKKPALAKRKKPALAKRRSRLWPERAGFWPEEAGFLRPKAGFFGQKSRLLLAKSRLLRPKEPAPLAKSRLLPAKAGSFWPESRLWPRKPALAKGAGFWGLQAPPLNPPPKGGESAALNGWKCQKNPKTLRFVMDRSDPQSGSDLGGLSL